MWVSKTTRNNKRAEKVAWAQNVALTATELCKRREGKKERRNMFEMRCSL